MKYRGPQRLAFVSTHPIQYHSPWFRALARQPGLDFEVLYGHQPDAQDQGRAGFGVAFEWDVPLLEGYAHRFLPNVAREPSAGTFAGVDTPTIGRELVRGRYDAVVLNGWHFKSAWQTIFACWRARIPIMVRSDSHLRTPRASWKQAAKRLAYRSFISRFDACLPVGTWSAEYFREYGARPERIFVVPHAVDSARFVETAARLEPERAALRQRWGVPPGSIVYLFAAKFIDKKRPLDFVDAVVRASRSAPVAGLMVGDGPLRAACEARAREAGAPVTFAGFLNQSEIVGAYVAADVLVLSSDGGETWGLVANEAMTCGRACIVTDQVGCGPDLISPGETGDHYPMGDVSALARCMEQYGQRPDQVRAMGERARARVRGYSVDAAVAGVLQAMDAVTGSKL